MRDKLNVFFDTNDIRTKHRLRVEFLDFFSSKFDDHIEYDILNIKLNSYIDACSLNKDSKHNCQFEDLIREYVLRIA